MSDGDEAFDMALKMRQWFLVPHAVSIPAIDKLGPPYAQIASAFQSNINGTITVVSVPFAMAQANTSDRAFQRISTAERIRSGVRPKAGAEYDPQEHEAINAAMLRAGSRFAEWYTSKAGHDELIRETSRYLIDAASHEQMGGAAAQLLLHGMSSLWTTFEVLARDLFEARLNSHPQEAKRLIEQPDAKKRYERHLRFTLDDLASVGFDLSAQMGTYLTQMQDLSDFISVRAAFEALFPDRGLFANAATNKRLVTLNAQRHLIVHQGGRVDARYQKATGSNAPIGLRLEVTPEEFDLSLHACVEVGNALLQCIVEL